MSRGPTLDLVIECPGSRLGGLKTFHETAIKHVGKKLTYFSSENGCLQFSIVRFHLIGKHRILMRISRRIYLIWRECSAEVLKKAFVQLDWNDTKTQLRFQTLHGETNRAERLALLQQTWHKEREISKLGSLHVHSFSCNKLRSSCYRTFWEISMIFMRTMLYPKVISFHAIRFMGICPSATLIHKDKKLAQ